MRLSLIGLLERLLVSAVLVGGSAATAIGQTTTAAILGAVTDESASALPGATVTAKNVDTGFTREVITSGTGTYRLSGLPPGQYEVKVSLPGFADQVRPGIALILGGGQQQNFTLKLAGLEETVTVTSTVPLVEIARTEVGAAVLQEQILALPLSSRTFTDLALVLPGVNADQRREWSDPVNIGAGSWAQTSYLMDGTNNVWLRTAEPRMNFMQDSVREFKVITTGSTAEYGSSAYGVVVGMSKSGTNAFGGSAFEFFRHKALNAKAAFETEKQPYHRHQFGGILGGPIWRDRAFFFAGIERSDEESSNNFSSGGVYPSLDGLFPSTFTQTLGTFKVDATFSPRHSGFIRYALQRRLQSRTNAGGNRHWTAGRDFDYPRDSVVLGLTSAFTSGVVNDFRVAWGRTDALEHSSSPPGLIGLTFDSMIYGQQSGYHPEWEVRVEIANDLSIFRSGWRGEHNLKMGVSLNPYIADWYDSYSCVDGCYRITGDVPGFPQVAIPWDTLFAQGRIRQLTFGWGGEYPTVNFPTYAAYVQDDWKPVPRLTLNLGLRYDYQIFHTAKYQGQPFVGTFKIPGVYDRSTRKPDRNNVAPRFGFAYDPSGEGKTVIRGSAGLYYQLLSLGRSYTEWRERDGANVNAVTIVNPHLTNWENPLAEIDPRTYAGAVRDIGVVANDAVNPASIQMGLGFSRELAHDLGLDVDYVRVKGWNEGYVHRNINAPDPVTGHRLTEQFRVVTQFEMVGRALYNALLVKLEKRFSRNLQLMGSYTLAKGENMFDGQSGTVANAYRLEDEYGPTTADRRHRLALSGITAALPGDLQFSWVLSAGTSRPFDVRAGRDLDRDGQFLDRPPGVTRNQACRDLDLAAVNAFRQALGQKPVNGIECQGRVVVDVRLGKTFRLGGAKRLELFFEVYNLANAKNLEYSKTSTAATEEQVLAATFGQPSRAGLPRQAALAARFSF